MIKNMKKIVIGFLFVSLLFISSFSVVRAQTVTLDINALRVQLLELVQKLTIILNQLTMSRLSLDMTRPTTTPPWLPLPPLPLPIPLPTPSDNYPPIISGVTGSTNLTPGESGTWQVIATDREGSRLAYAAFWGDYDTPIFNDQGSFSHVYQTPGAYYLTFTVTDAGGKTTRANASVTVANRTIPNITGSAEITAIDDTTGETLTAAQVSVVSLAGRIIGTGNTYRGPVVFSNLPIGTYTVMAVSFGYRLGNTSFSIVRSGDVARPVVRLTKLR